MEMRGNQNRSWCARCIAHCAADNIGLQKSRACRPHANGDKRLRPVML
jgi:hypothetical protein